MSADITRASISSTLSESPPSAVKLSFRPTWFSRRTSAQIRSRRPSVGVAGGGVEQRPTCVDELPELLGGLVLVGVAAPRHRAQAQVGDPQAGASELPLFHGAERYLRPAPGPRTRVTDRVTGGRGAGWAVRRG